MTAAGCATGTNENRVLEAKSHALKILPVSDCSPWIISRFSANSLIPEIRGEGYPTEEGRVPKWECDYLKEFGNSDSAFD